MPIKIKIPAGLRIGNEIQIYLNGKKRNLIKYDIKNNDDNITVVDLINNSENKLRVETSKKMSNTIRVEDGDIIEISQRLYLKNLAFVVPVIYLIELIVRSPFPDLRIPWSVKVILLIFAVIIFGALLVLGEIRMKKINE